MGTDASGVVLVGTSALSIVRRVLGLFKGRWG